MIRIKGMCLFVLSICSFMIANCQQAPNYVFNNRDDVFDDNIDSGTKVRYYNDGILYMGFCYDSTQTEGTTVSFYDTLGNFKWKKVIFYPPYRGIQGNDIISLNNGSFYIAGVAWKDTVTQWDIFLAKFDVNGDTIFFKIYSDSVNSWAMNMVQFDADTILLLSDYQISDGDHLVKILLSKIDSVGNFIVTDSSDFALKAGYQVLKAPGNKIYVGGTMPTDSISYYVKVFIKVYDYNLNNIETWYPSLDTNEYFDQMVLWNNNLFVTSSVTTYYPPNQNYGSFYQCRLGKIDTTLGKYDTFNQFGRIHYWTAERPPLVLNDNYLLLPFSGQPDSVIDFIDTNLTLVCQTKLKCPSVIDISGEQTLYDAQILPGKKLAGTGYLVPPLTDTTQWQDTWNFLTENLEDYINANCNSTSIEEYANENLFFISPNPTSNNFTVHLTSAPQNSRLEIFNMVGEKIYEQVINREEITIDLKSSPGIYLINVFNAEKVSIGKIILQ
jgi:hypothetical protein